MPNKGGRCLFASCNSSYNNDCGVKFFRVPLKKDTEIAKLWLSRAKRADIAFSDLKSSHRVCSLHFSPADIVPHIHGGRTQYRLKPDALPYPNGSLPPAVTRQTRSRTDVSVQIMLISLLLSCFCSM
jgi:hypothetical protein